MKLKNLTIFFTITLALNSLNSYSQVKNPSELNGQNAEKIIQTAVPFLTIATDSRSGAMGDAGVALSPDANSMHWNPAKYAFVENKAGVALSYTPWLRNLVGDINLTNLAAFYKIDRMQTVALSLVYFSMGEIQFTDINAQAIKTARPNEFSIDGAYSRKLSDHLSGGLAFRYIRSDLASGTQVNGVDTKAGNAVAADVSVFYDKKLNLGKLNFGLNISNIGTKINYTDDLAKKDFLPTNLKLGGAITKEMDEYNSITVTADLNKLLVPTTPIYSDSINAVTGKQDIRIAGLSDNVSIVQGMVQSLYDAPGGFKEKMHEIMYSIGAEYWYRKQFAVRAGYFHESETKGNRKFFTVGLGLRLNVFGIDVSYLVPQQANNPLANTLRFTLSFNLMDPQKK